METKRLFWALSVGGESILNSASYKKVHTCSKVRGLDVKWTPQENFHITLCFLGDVESACLDDIIDLGRKGIEDHLKLDIKLRGVGAFPSQSSGRVLWVGVQAKRELITLRDDLYKAMHPFVDLEDREYVPHLTIGRLRSKRNVTDLLSPMNKKDFGKVRANEVILYESKFGGGFVRYRPIERIALQDSSEIEMQSLA
ncbi:MAG: RNA 2',3'-cyclic phosphodiesterase [Bacteriovoracaceae bacterium]|nr:RNA 2',3'-cyclic phosphodiesterase [Bacteriovoracaceae bacterium]